MNDVDSRSVVLAARRQDDLGLAQRCVSGDREAQRTLFQRQRLRVHATLYRVLGSNAQMEDLVQEAFLEIFRSLDSYRGDAQLSTWIDRISVRVAYAHLSRNPGRLLYLDVIPEMVANEPSLDRQVLAREATRRVYEVLDRVDPKQRIAFALHVLDGRPLKEVARVMKSSLVATKTRVWRARRALEKRARRDPVLAAFVREGTRSEG